MEQARVRRSRSRRPVAVPALRRAARLLTAIQDPAAIHEVLAAMGLSAAVGELVAARSPPGEVGIEFSG